MSQNPTEPSFVVHDVTAFPVLRSRPDAVQPGYAAQWEREMDALLARGQPFVILFEAAHPEEEHEDRKIRGLWIKRNKDRLAQLCKALIRVEPDPEKWPLQQAQAAMATKAFGIANEFASSPKEAEQRAREILG